MPAPARERRAAHWVAPELVAEIRFSNWTRDGMLRHPVFLGLRKDKPASEVKRETPVEVKKEKKLPREKAKSATSSGKAVGETNGVRLTHPDKVLDRDSGVTKQQLADYCALVGEMMLPHVVNRPLTLLRCPGGTAGKCFYQRNWTETVPESVKGKRARGMEETPLAINDLAGLLALVQINALEIHTWNCQLADIEHPDQLVFDLDPGPGVTWKQIVEGARMLQRQLDALALPTFIKTSGGKGLHITIPIAPNITWDVGKTFCNQVALALAKKSDLFVANMRKDLRQGKIYVDFQRNGQSATAIAPYSARARAGMAVSMPIGWRDLASLKSADQFTVVSAAEFLRRKNDPWSDFERSRIDLRRLAGNT
jgi:bifunctional non-homologous end joining protein LigD